MEVGQLNRKVTILHQQPGQDAAGQPNTAWSRYAQPWANVKHLTGAAAIRADAQTASVQVSIRIRYRLDITDAMRVQHRTKVYEIKAVLPDEVHQEHTDLVCELLP